jgi:secreted PhoX family phosphatase
VPCKWVKIADPERPHSPDTTDGGGCFSQGKAQGGTSFARLEGAWQGEGKIYFTATSGGKAKCGQVFEYDPKTSMLRIVYESPGADICDYPDNIAVSPRGGILLCEDGGARAKRLHGLTTKGVLFPFAVNNVNLTDPYMGHKGNFVEQEWAGATFSEDGKWMFANIQTPGITFAITGPWEDGEL